MAYTDQQIKDYAHKLEAAQAPSSAIEDFVKKAKQEQTPTLLGAGAGPQSKVKTAPWDIIPAQPGKESYGKAALKTVANVVPSAANLIIGGPLQMAWQGVKGFAKSLSGVAGAVGSIAQGKLPEDFAAIQGRVPEAVGAYLEAVPGALTKSLVPQAWQQVATGIDAYLRGHTSDGDKAFLEVQRAFEQDPAGTWGPVVLGLRAGVKSIYGTKGVTVFDDALAKNVVTKPIVKGVQAAIEKPTGPLRAPFKTSFLPERKAAIQAQGMEPTVGTTTSSRFLKGFESLVAQGIFGGKLQARVDAMYNVLTNSGKAILEKLTPERLATSDNMGLDIKQGLENGLALEKTKVQDSFKAADNAYGKATAEANTTKTAVDSVAKEQGAGFQGQTSWLTKLASKLKGSVPPGLEELRKALTDKATGQLFSPERMRSMGVPERDIQVLTGSKLTYTNLSAMRSEIGDLMQRNPGSAEWGQLNKVYGALTEDMIKTVESANEGAGASLRKLWNDWSKFKESSNSNIAKAIEQSSPERVVDTIVTKNSASTLRQLRSILPPKVWVQNIVKAFYQKLVDSAYDTKGNIKPGGMDDFLKGYDENTLNEILTPKQLELIRAANTKLGTVTDIREWLKEGARPSQVGRDVFRGKVSFEMARVSALATAILLGHKLAAIGTLGLSLAADLAAAKVLGSETGVKWLTQGLELPNVPAPGFIPKIEGPQQQNQPQPVGMTAPPVQ